MSWTNRGEATVSPRSLDSEFVMQRDRLRRLAGFARIVFLRVPEFMLATLVAILVIFLTGSVIARYVANIGIGWSDEAAELIFVWITFLGFAVASKRRANVSVDLLIDRLPGSWRKTIEVLQDVIILVFSVVFTKESLVTMHFAFLQVFPGLQISIAWLYAATLVGGILMSLYAAVNLWDTVRGKRQRTGMLGDAESAHAE